MEALNGHVTSLHHKVQPLLSKSSRKGPEETVAITGQLTQSCDTDVVAHHASLKPREAALELLCVAVA
eukprot:4029546-Pleurochrysis_carterae.AAC.2